MGVPDHEERSEPDTAVKAPSLSSGPVRRHSSEEPVLPEVTRDERDEGWNEARGDYSDEWYLNERPPHHG